MGAAENFLIGASRDERRCAAADAELVCSLALDPWIEGSWELVTRLEWKGCRPEATSVRGLIRPHHHGGPTTSELRVQSESFSRPVLALSDPS